MASSNGVYQPCPCGSGKKIKFCCNTVIGEMDRVARFHERGQLIQALDALTRLERQFPTAAIIPITRTQILMEGRAYSEAAKVMREFLKSHPDNGPGTGLLGFSQCLAVGFEEAKPEVHRAFQVCPTSAPDIIASLAWHIAQELLRRNSTMAAREHLGLALRLTQDPEDRQSLFTRMMRLDGQVDIPFPLRSTHQLAKIDPPEGYEKDLRNAYRLSQVGCWEIAAKLFVKVSEKLPDSWALWKNIGLCRAWDDNKTGAAEALHRAAELAAEYEDAVECETLAQLLDLGSGDEMIPVAASRFLVRSVPQAINLLEADAQLAQIPVNKTPANGDNSKQAHFYYLSLPWQGTSSSDLASCPHIVADISVDLRDDESELGFISLYGVKTDAYHAAVDRIESLLAGELVPQLAHHSHDCAQDHDHDTPHETNRVDSVLRQISREFMAVQQNQYFGAKPNLYELRSYQKQRAESLVWNSWLNTPLGRLGGKTPREASQDAGLRVKLAAAVHVIESGPFDASRLVDFARVREELKIQPERTITPDEQTLNALSVQQSHRLALNELSDEQLGHVLHRAMLIRYTPFVYALLQEIQRRGLENMQGMDPYTFYKTFSESANDLCRVAEAAQWARAARLEAENGDDFNRKIDAAMKEFFLVIDTPTDPAFQEIVSRLWNYYGAKLPDIRDAISSRLQERGLPVPA